MFSGVIRWNKENYARSRANEKDNQLANLYANDYVIAGGSGLR
jgi:hypothetical protein